AARASTRPQHFAADHLVRGDSAVLLRLLQRGRSILLRITNHCPDVKAAVPGFNEAAAFCCGSPLATLMCLRARTELQRGRSILLRLTLRPFVPTRPGHSASTRPQHFAADHTCPAPSLAALPRRFNEAAAFCCGSRAAQLPALALHVLLQRGRSI